MAIVIKYAFWPFLLDPPDSPSPAPEDEYGPITDEWCDKGEVEGATFEEAQSKLPECAPGCYWGLVGINV